MRRMYGGFSVFFIVVFVPCRESDRGTIDDDESNPPHDCPPQHTRAPAFRSVFPSRRRLRCAVVRRFAPGVAADVVPGFKTYCVWRGYKVKVRVAFETDLDVVLSDDGEE
jgi:hypothetical protein